jgi:multisubunit Na+/H+ antiporter MnhE subunit
MSADSTSKAILRFTAWWIALFAAYMLFSETASPGEIGASGLCATIGAVAVTRLRRNTSRRFAVRPWWIIRLAAKQVPVAFAECWLLFLALFKPLAERRAGLGITMAIPFNGDAGRTQAEAAGRRALITTAMCFTPNSVVIGLEMQPGHLLVHQLSPTPQPPGHGDPVWPV